jgi:hypothetical protein
MREARGGRERRRRHLEVYLRKEKLLDVARKHLFAMQEQQSHRLSEQGNKFILRVTEQK